MTLRVMRPRSLAATWMGSTHLRAHVHVREVRCLSSNLTSELTFEDGEHHQIVERGSGTALRLAARRRPMHAVYHTPLECRIEAVDGRIVCQDQRSHSWREISIHLLQLLEGLEPERAVKEPGGTRCPEHRRPTTCRLARARGSDEVRHRTLNETSQ